MPVFSENSITFAGVFLLGLGLNLTPCVYPMISITVSLFRTQKETSHAHAFLKSLIYVLGMSLIYTALGVTTAFTGGLFGAALQSRWVLFSVGVLMLAMAASLFGFYTIQAPAWMTRLATRRGTDLLGTFLSGLFVGVFAAPCIGPLIIALIAFVAQKGDPFFAFQIFFTLSMGLGLPYILLGTFAGLLQKLPKSGVWLIWVDRFLGTVLLTVAAFYFMLALHSKWLPFLIPAALLLGGLYLGFLESSKKYSQNFLNFKKTVGLIAILAGILLPVFAPRQHVRWENFSQEKIKQAIQQHQPILMDFYADWCIPCHELDRYTYSNPEVILKLENFAKMKVDLTSPEDPATQDLIEKYNILGVPTVLFLDSEGKEIPQTRITGFVPAKEFLEILDEKVLKH